MVDAAPTSANAAPASAAPQNSQATNADEGPHEPRKSVNTGPGATTPPKSEPKPKAEAKTTPKPPEKSEKSPQPEDDDPEFEVDGEKVRRSELLEQHKRRKEFERASHQRMQEAAKLRKEREAEEARYQEAFQRLDQDPWALHRARGWDDARIAQAAEAALVQQVKRAQMTPQELQAEQIHNENARLKQENEQLKQKQQQEAHAALKQRYVQHFDQQIGQAMEAGKLARTSSTAAKVANVIAQYLQAGEQIDPALAAQIVRDDHHTSIRHEFTELRDQLKSGRITQEKFQAYVADLVGPETIKLFQQSAIKKAQDFEPQKAAAPRQPAAPPKGGFDSFEEANKWIDKKIGAKHHG